MKLLALSDIKVPASSELGKIEKNQVFTCNDDLGEELIEKGLAKKAATNYKDMTTKSVYGPKVELKIDGDELIKQLDKAKIKEHGESFISD